MRLRSRRPALLTTSLLLALVLASFGVALADPPGEKARTKPVPTDPNRPRPGLPDGGGNPAGRLQVVIMPATWSTSWVNNGGPVNLILRGNGAERVDLDSIRFVGDPMRGPALTPFVVRRAGRQVVARFTKQNAYATLNDPDVGETHVVRVRFSIGNDTVERKLAVKIVQ